MPTLEGQSIGEFEILSSLGQGGMGTVYLAKQSSLNRNVAIKVLPPHLAENATYIERFRREGAAAASFSHPDIVQVFAAGEFNGIHYLAMEYVNGESLQDRLTREGRIPPTESLAIAAHIAQALSYAWQKAQLIHRDVKPSNILISNEGHVKLSDLGMAKCVSENASQLTSTGMALGTPNYISPEQARATADIDFRADIYSLGCTLYHMLTGQVPYKASDPVAVILKHVNDPLPDILAAMPDCPPAIVTLLNRMLAKDRDQRQQSYDELVTELFAAHDQITQGPVSVPKPRAHTLTYAVAAVAVVAIITGILIWSPWRSSAPQQVQAKATANVAQPPPNATATSPQTEVAKAATTPSPAEPAKPAGDKGTSTQPASLTETTASAPPAKPAETQPIMAQQTPPAATANANNIDATSAGQSQPMVATTAASTPAPDTTKPAPTTTEPSKDASAAKPAPASTPESRLPNPESRVTSPEPRIPNPEPRLSDTDSAFIKSVAALPPEQQISHVMAKLKELNPQFDGKESHKIESVAVTELAFSTVGVTDIAPLKALKWLKRLSMAPTALNQKGAVSDLSPLAGLPLTGLWCQGNAISDLSPLKGMPLTVLSCGGTQIKDLSSLTGMKLTVLSFNDTEVADLGPLEGMPLTVLWCNNTKATDLSPLKAMPLQELKCDFVADRDTELLRGVKTLAKINDKPAATFWATLKPAVRPPTSIVRPMATTPTTVASPGGPEKTMTTSTGMELVWIPPGEFMLGSTQEEKDWAIRNGANNGWVKTEGAQPQQAVIKEGFWLGKTEVTVGQWKQFAAATSYVTDGEKGTSTVPPQGTRKHWENLKGASWKNPGFDSKPKDTNPVSCISWNDAVAFCQWLTTSEQKANKLPAGLIYRLPTEAEWEYACRAKTTTKYWWGDTAENATRRWNVAGSQDGLEFVSRVDQFGPRGRNQFGLADMLGNVNEWCLDSFDPARAHEECCKKEGDIHVFRGGSFNEPPAAVRCAMRYGRPAIYSHACFGFRISCGVPK